MRAIPRAVPEATPPRLAKETVVNRLAGKTAIITGAGSGLGRESALLFAEEGANVVVTDKVDKRAENVTAEIIGRGGKAVGLTADVTVEADMQAACERAVSEFGRLDIMYANAGVAPRDYAQVPFEEFTEEDWDAVNDVVFKGVFLACKQAVRVMKGQGGGTIVVTTSSGSFVAVPGFFAYNAGKGGANMLVRSMAVDLGHYGIRANALAPHAGMSANFMMDPDADVLGLSYEQAAVAVQDGWDPRSSPLVLKLSRPPTLRDNANVALFLASDESAYMSGVVIPATDGGMLSRYGSEFGLFEQGWQGQMQEMLAQAAKLKQ